MGNDNLERNPKSEPKKFSCLCTFKRNEFKYGTSPAEIVIAIGQLTGELDFYKIIRRQRKSIFGP